MSIAIDMSFETFVRDFWATAIELRGQASSTEAHQQWALASIRKPVIDEPRGDRIHAEIWALSGAYEMPMAGR